MKEILTEIKEFNPGLIFKIVLNDFAGNRKFYKDLEPLLRDDENFSGVEIPSREYVNTCNTLKKPALENPDILTAFTKFSDVVL